MRAQVECGGRLRGVPALLRGPWLSVLLLQHGGARAAAHPRRSRGTLRKVLARTGFRGHETTAIRDIVMENADLFLEKWYEYFGGRS